MVHVRAILCALAAQTALAFLPADPSIREDLERRHLDQHGGEPESNSSAKPVRQTVYPSVIVHRENSQTVLDAINLDRMVNSMETLTSYNNRHYQSVTGAHASDWIYEKVKRYAGTFKISRKKHDWPQRSIDVQISEGTGNKRQDKRVIVVGAHMDSINKSDKRYKPVDAEAPGADDNASGVAVLLEALYLLLRDPRVKHFRNQVHFHFWSAEEVGLQGSKEMFQQYAKEGIDVVAVLNQDMTGRASKDGPDTFTVITDFVYAPLNDFLVKVINSYTNLGFREWLCGYGCSDHASATRAGFPAASITHSLVADNDFKYIHTVNDTLEEIDYIHMREHVRLVLGYVLELGFAEFPASTSASTTSASTTSASTTSASTTSASTTSASTTSASVASSTTTAAAETTTSGMIELPEVKTEEDA